MVFSFYSACRSFFLCSCLFLVFVVVIVVGVVLHQKILILFFTSLPISPVTWFILSVCCFDLNVDVVHAGWRFLCCIAGVREEGGNETRSRDGVAADQALGREQRRGPELRGAREVGVGCWFLLPLEKQNLALFVQ